MMSRDRRWRRYARFWGPDVRADIDDELECHIDLRTQELMRTGLTPSSARARALDEFGDLQGARQECHRIDEQRLRRMRRADVLDGVWQDVRFAVRSLRRNPAFTIVAVLALALGVGANAAVFGVVDAAAFRPLPVPAPERLHAIFGAAGEQTLFNVPYLAVEQLRRNPDVFEGVAAFSERPVALSSGGDPRVVWSNLASDDYFSTVGVRAARGRVFERGDQFQPVVVLSDALWRSQFAADPAVVGRTIELNGFPYTVIGVAPREYLSTRLFSYAPALWVPLGMHAQLDPGSEGMLTTRSAGGVQVIARVRPGVASAALSAALERVAEVERTFDRTRLVDYRLHTIPNRTPINPWLARPQQIRSIARLFVAGVMLVLLVACLDVANLLLARMTARRGEVAMRLSLGAGRGRIIRQLLTESLVLALLGGLAAIPVAYAVMQLSTQLEPQLDHATAYRPVLDARVLVFAALAALASGIVFGLLPAWRGTKEGLAQSLRREGGGGAHRRSRLRDALVVVQVAVSIVVLTAAGLFAASLRQARAFDPGFRLEAGTVFTLDPQLLPGYDSTRIAAFYRELMPQLAAVPGVDAVTRATTLPLDGNSSRARVFRDGGPSAPEDAVWTDYAYVAPGYHGVLGTPLLEGRDFQAQDRDAGPRVVINRALAEQLWPGESPLGRRIRIGSPDASPIEVIGLTPTGRYSRLGGAPEPALTLNIERGEQGTANVLVRSSLPPATLYPALRRTVHSLEPHLPVTGIKTLQDHISPAYAAVESGAFGATLFGVLALLLAAAGIYGVVSYGVAQQRREIGIRMAVGADRGQVLGMVLRAAGKLTLLGAVLGGALAALSTSALRGLLFVNDGMAPLVIVAVTALIAAVTLVASWLPARRAARVDPALTLRL